jgi:hypothetical protein
VSLPKRGKIQVTFDCANPVELAAFWAEVLRYPPPDVEAFQEHLRSDGVPEDRLGDWRIIGDPTGSEPRVFFQKVPEPKTAKNRVHLDVRIRSGGPSDPKDIDAEVDRLADLGGTKVRSVTDGDGYFVVMRDPEGNEFCID